jgi:hypothetical protein
MSDELAVGEQEEKWFDNLPEQYHEGISKFKSQEDLAKSYLNLEKSASSKVKIPGDEASDEDWGKFYNKLGRPEKADEYSVDIENTNEDFVKAFKGMSHSANLSRKQFEKIATGLYEYESNQIEAAKAAREKAQTETLEKLGAEVGGKEKLDEVISTAVAAVDEIEKKHGLTGLKEYFDESGHGDNPLMIKLFSFIGQNILSDTLVKGSPPGKAGTQQRWEKEFHERYDNKAS